eukprot:10363089-Lingulodinium_polyedra.AAC.1
MSIDRSLTRVDPYCGLLYEQNSVHQARNLVGCFCLIPLVLPATVGFMERMTFSGDLLVMAFQLPKESDSQ